MKVRDLMTEQVPYCRASDMASHAARVMMDLGVGGWSRLLTRNRRVRCSEW